MLDSKLNHDIGFSDFYGFLKAILAYIGMASLADHERIFPAPFASLFTVILPSEAVNSELLTAFQNVGALEYVARLLPTGQRRS